MTPTLPDTLCFAGYGDPANLLCDECLVSSFNLRWDAELGCVTVTCECCTTSTHMHLTPAL